MKKVLSLVLFVLVALFQTGDVAWGQNGQERAVIEQAVSDGWFRGCQAGSSDACAIFTREVARRLNPSASEAGWGALSKSGGEEGANSDNGTRYSVDALVWTADPNNLNNVVDIVGGAGAPGARPGMGGYVQRRPSNRWANPSPISAREASIACQGVCADGSGGGPGPGTPNPPQPPAPAPVDLSGVISKLNELIGHIVALNQHVERSDANVASRIDALDAHLGQVEAQVHRNGAALLEAKNFLENPVPYRGSILGIPVSLNPQGR